MMMVLSPAKTLDMQSDIAFNKFSEPRFLKDSRQLIRGLKKLAVQDLQELMHISDRLATQNSQRYAAWRTPFTTENSRQAIFAFKGDVYLGLKAHEFSSADLDYAQQHLRILSGLYGLLRPLDLMQAYRLEMGTAFANKKGTDLYRFWGTKLTTCLRNEITAQGSTVLVNLASNEYFQALQEDKLDAQIITPVFKDYSNGQYRFLSFFAKQARGSMAAWLIKNRIAGTADIAAFNVEGYRYSPELSSIDSPVFLRDKQPPLRKKTS